MLWACWLLTVFMPKMTMIHCYPMLGRIFPQLVWKSFWNGMQTIMLHFPWILQQNSFESITATKTSDAWIILTWHVKISKYVWVDTSFGIMNSMSSIRWHTINKIKRVNCVFLKVMIKIWVHNNWSWSNSLTCYEKVCQVLNMSSMTFPGHKLITNAWMCSVIFI